MHALRAKVRSAPGQRTSMIGAGFGNDWTFSARGIAASSAGRSMVVLLLLGGRGGGKTHAESQAIHTAVRAGVMRIGLISTTAAVLDAVNLEGPSGLLKTARAGVVPRVVQYKRRVEFMNGATVSLFSGEEPESLRGYQFEMVVIDELAKMRYAQQGFDQAMLTLRLGEKPRMIIATTPRPTPFMLKVIRMEGVTITRSTTFDNAEHLSADGLSRLRKACGGASREWLQEIQGEMVLVPEGALFREEWLKHDDGARETIEQATVGVDPSGGSDETGIVAAALLRASRLAVLADRSLPGRRLNGAKPRCAPTMISTPTTSRLRSTTAARWRPTSSSRRRGTPPREGRTRERHDPRQGSDGQPRLGYEGGAHVAFV